MAQIFVHILNNHFQIDDFVCKASEVMEVIEIPQYDAKYFELQFNTNKLMANYLKYSRENDIMVVSITKTLQSFCENFIKNKVEYIAKIEEKRTQKLLQQEEERLVLSQLLVNQEGAAAL
jgi:hypothetical protein